MSSTVIPHLLTLRGEDVIPSPQVILRRSKRYRAGSGQKAIRVLDEALEIALPLIHPAAVWALKPLDRTAGSIPAGLAEDLYTRLTLHFGVVCTIGGELEARSRDTFRQQQFTLGYFLDQIGTFSVSLLAQQTASLLCKQYGAIRWAPGDQAEDRSFQTQEDLFSWVPAGEIGVRLTAHNVMSPVKSLSYNLYAGPDLQGVECMIACSHCVWNGACDKQR
jgi:hypothetical protein